MSKTPHWNITWLWIYIRWGVRRLTPHSTDLFILNDPMMNTTATQFQRSGTALDCWSFIITFQAILVQVSRIERYSFATYHSWLHFTQFSFRKLDICVAHTDNLTSTVIIFARFYRQSWFSTMSGKFSDKKVFMPECFLFLFIWRKRNCIACVQKSFKLPGSLVWKEITIAKQKAWFFHNLYIPRSFYGLVLLLMEK